MLVQIIAAAIEYFSKKVLPTLSWVYAFGGLGQVNLAQVIRVIEYLTDMPVYIFDFILSTLEDLIKKPV